MLELKPAKLEARVQGLFVAAEPSVDVYGGCFGHWPEEDTRAIPREEVGPGVRFSDDPDHRFDAGAHRWGARHKRLDTGVFGVVEELHERGTRSTGGG